MKLLVILIYISMCLTQDENIITINASSYDFWIYFSLESGSEVEIDDPENSLDWDLGFKRNHIKTNNGMSGIGDAEGCFIDENQIWDLGLWEYTTEIPSNLNCQVDAVIEGNILIQQGCYCETLDQVGCEASHVFIDCIKNPVLDQWGLFDNDRHFNETDIVFFVKASNGKYFKFWPFSYYYTVNGASGFVEFMYESICNIQIGDINSDNLSNIEDIIQTINYIIDEVYFDDCQINAADYNENGFTNVIDVLLMVNAINP